MKRGITLAAVSLVILSALVYAGDYVVLRYRVAKGKQPFGTVSVYSYYAVQEKNHKTEFLSGSTEDDTCVHSLFPHLGYSPCWYLNRHAEHRIDL
jgi:hypothetical protein